ncbi:alanine racemase [Campylobacter sp. MIT 21-1685]|uniref:alanine racemase n=1 Tax=unclassified Campylobacter TaxID=2593542 RepID=UPI00224ACB78|nr:MULTISPECIES: alanine racemase [unclassified Campylobacter]MCX2682817.1 alanine racemase [Campylobacter sp. MIT 21-1684]MCX2751037.1 alanine racemase [Campylobacter sp. MIT 21-1682]MCX2807298.1 alanine racemase [Campylobacter sp. MIT 21-1685]
MSLIKLHKASYEFNLEKIASKAGGFNKLICIFKDNAYGHGARLLAPVAKEKGISFIAVKNEHEARELEDIFDSILILSHRPNANENPRFIYALNEPSKINEYKKGTRIHLKIDTGMHRNGIYIEDLPEFYKIFKQKALQLEGAFTHFASADELDGSFFVQYKKFQEAKELIRGLTRKQLLFHSYNSSALFRNPSFPQDELCRVGLSQFGYTDESLKKVLHLYAHKLSQRTLKKGQSVGYGQSFSASKKLQIATYDLGYADGLLRYNGVGDLYLANGKKILGRISMDSFSCEDGGEELCVFNDANIWAKFFQTIPYEILVKLHPQLPRILV